MFFVFCSFLFFGLQFVSVPPGCITHPALTSLVRPSTVVVATMACFGKCLSSEDTVDSILPSHARMPGSPKARLSVGLSAELFPSVTAGRSDAAIAVPASPSNMVSTKSPAYISNNTGAFPPVPPCQHATHTAWWPLFVTNIHTCLCRQSISILYCLLLCQWVMCICEC